MVPTDKTVPMDIACARLLHITGYLRTTETVRMDYTVYGFKIYQARILVYFLSFNYFPERKFLHLS